MCLAVAMIVAGVASLNNALPHIAEDLDVSQASQQWIIDAYAVALAALLLPFGAFGDRFGRRLTLLTGVGIFAVASAAAAMSDSGTALIAARAAMGVGAAFAMPATLSTITSVYPPESRAKAVGIWAGFAGTGATIGLLLSGGLLEQFWWGSTFLANAVVAAVTFGIILVAVPSTRSSERVGLDPLGSVLSVLGIGGVVLGIIEGPERGWTDPITLLGLLGGTLALAAFVRAELRSRSPLLDPRLFRIRGFATGSASLFLQFFAMFGFFFVVIQFLQLVKGYSALDSAIAVLPMSAVMIPLSTVAAGLSERYGQRVIGAFGLALSAISMGYFVSLGVSSSYFHLLAGMLVLAAGMALAMTPATNAIVSSLPAAKQGVASAVNDTARELGGAFGIALVGSAFNIGYRGAIDSRISTFPTEIADGAKESPAIALEASRGIGSPGSLLADATRTSFMVGMRWAVVVGAALLVIGAAYVWLRGSSVETAEADDVLDLPADDGVELEVALARASD
jgi:EmrB/QacA subfamily drug resistance transporter